MIVDIGIVTLKAFLVVFMVLNLAGVLGWIERKGSALIQDRIGANRASIFGFAGLGLVNTLSCRPAQIFDQRGFYSAGGRQVPAYSGALSGLVPGFSDFRGHSFRRRSSDRRAGDQPPGCQSQRRHPLSLCHDLFGRLRSRDWRLGIEQ